MKYVWFWKTRLPERKGSPCRVLARGGMNSILVEFEDGYKVVTSRYAVRKVKNMRKRDEFPLTIIRESEKVVVSFCKWLPYQDKILRHHSYYEPSKTSLARIERIAQAMDARVNILDPRITTYTKTTCIKVGENDPQA